MKKSLLLFVFGFIALAVADDVIVIDVGGGDVEVTCEHQCIVEFDPDSSSATIEDSAGGWVTTAPFYGTTQGGAGTTPWGTGSVGCGLFEVCRPSPIPTGDF